MDLIEIASGSVRYVASKAAGLSALILDDDTVGTYLTAALCFFCSVLILLLF